MIPDWLSQWRNANRLTDDFDTNYKRHLSSLYTNIFQHSSVYQLEAGGQPIRQQFSKYY